MHNRSRSNDDLEKQQQDKAPQKQSESPKGDSSMEQSANTTTQEQCRICQQDKEEKEDLLIELGCQCRGDLAKAHKSCIDVWFGSKGSNQCEICRQTIAVNVSAPVTDHVNVKAPVTQPTNDDLVLMVDLTIREEERESRCLSPLWLIVINVIAGLMLTGLISFTLGAFGRPVDMFIVIAVALVITFLLWGAHICRTRD